MKRCPTGRLFVVQGSVRLERLESAALGGPSSSGYFDRDYFAWLGERAERSARVVVPLQPTSTTLRARVWEDERVDWWYAQNALLYVREDRLAALGLHPVERVLALVHPIHFLEVAERRREDQEARWLERLRRRRSS